MSKFQLKPIIKPDSNKLPEAYKVVVDLKRQVGNVMVVVPKFFQYDGSSIPTAAWPLIGTPFNTRFMTASVFHDWIYHTHSMSRKAADQLLHDVLIEDGVPEAKAWIMHSAVSNFGKPYWANDADDNSCIGRLTDRIKKDGRDPATYGLPRFHNACPPTKKAETFRSPPLRLFRVAR